MSELTVTAADDGGTFRIAPGDLVTVRLSETPGTGYRWQVAAGAGLELVSSDYVHSANSAVGGGGTRVVRLRAARPGSARVELMLRRPWEKAEAAAGNVRFTIEVGASGE